MTTPSWQPLNDYLERERERRKESIRRFATIIGVSHKAYLFWLRGAAEPRLEALELISVALDQPLGYILELAGHHDPHFTDTERAATLSEARHPPLGLSEQDLADLRRLPRDEQNRLLGVLQRALARLRHPTNASAHDDAQD